MRTPGDHIRFVANETFHGKDPSMERAMFKYGPDRTVDHAQVRTGEVDVVIGGLPERLCKILTRD